MIFRQKDILWCNFALGTKTKGGAKSLPNLALPYSWNTHFRHSAPAPSSCARPLFFFLKSTKMRRMMTGMMTIMVKICTLTCHIVCCLWHHFSIAKKCVWPVMYCARFPRLRPFILETMGWCNMYLAGIVWPYGESFGFDSLAFHFWQLYHQWWPTQNV